MNLIAAENPHNMSLQYEHLGSQERKYMPHQEHSFERSIDNVMNMSACYLPNQTADY